MGINVCEWNTVNRAAATNGRGTPVDGGQCAARAPALSVFLLVRIRVRALFVKIRAVLVVVLIPKN